MLVKTDGELRKIIKAPPGTVTEKILPGPLRAAPSEFLAAARFALVTTVSTEGLPRLTAFGGDPGFVSQTADRTLLVPGAGANLNQIVGRGFAGLLLMAPGVRYTLRVNGAIALDDKGLSLQITPQQSYAHCAKAFIRSKLWSAHSPTATSDAPIPHEPGDEIDAACAEFIRAAPFAALGTSLIDGEADTSPRGDPAGFIQVVDEHTVFVPDRPGNRIADSLRNIINTPKASLLLLVPGQTRSLELVGEAAITTDPALCGLAEVNGRVPKLGILLKVQQITFKEEAALESAELWNPDSYIDESALPTIGALVVDPTQKRSLALKALAGAANKLTDRDYKVNLY